jgi:hypothetical protein
MLESGARGWLALIGACALLGVACGDDGQADTATEDGGSGSGGASGSAGSAGSGASGGSGGTGGSGATGGSAGSGGSAGAAGSSGSAGAAGNPCNDPGPEPNDSEALASPACGTPPCEAGDCDDEGSTGYGGPLAPATGTIGPNEVDFLKYDGADNLGLCTVNAMATTEDSGFRLCLFPSCNAATTLNGCTQGNLEVSPTGIQGCCTTAPGTVEADHDCTGTPTDDDSAHIFLRIDEATACTTYTVDYHF